MLPAACLFETRCNDAGDCGSDEACIDGICADAYDDDYDDDYDPGGGSCVDAGSSCAAASCCGSAVCVDFEGIGPVCADQCSSDSGCISGCCNATNSGTLVCAPSNFCF